MLKDRLSPADEAARDKEMQEALAACPRILDLIARGPQGAPDAEAAIYLRSPLDPNPVVISNDHLMGCVKAAENYFRAQGVGKNDAVAILLPACPATVVAIFGAAACGIAEPLNLLFTREAIIAQLNAIEAKLLLAPPPGMPGGLYEKIEGLPREVPTLKRIVIVPLDGSIAFDGEPLRPDPAWRDDYGKSKDMSEADRVAVMLPTGGTTGHPKVARLTNRAMVASTISSKMALDFHRGERGMITLPLFHVGGLFCTVANCLASGVTMLVPGPAGARDPALITNFWKIVEQYRINIAGNVPTVLGAIADVPVADSDISSLRVTATGASICPLEIERRYLATWGGPCIQQLYGMTELAGAITHDVHGVKPRAESVGTRNPLVELAILEGGKLHTGPWPSPVGELLTKGPQVFAGYVDKTQTEDAFHDGWLRTGDICRIDADGFVYIMGRAKDVIIRGGHNIDPRAIEDAALQFPGVALAAAVGRPDTYAGEVPMLFVSAQPGVHIDAQALAAFVQDNIPEPPARPRAVSIIAEMPVTPVGKIFKPKLREIAAGEAARELLALEGLSKEVSVDAITDPSRGLVLSVTATPDKAETAERLLKKFPVKVELRS
ncbi:MULTISPECIES: AMP-binding protein [unclassified Bradyrhizobium]|uniref:AMP-binding protein n=1 Tax=unclassified Bradyrhizobium TaxID=2631580 RepID=UPI002479429C|nr:MULTISPECIES: AMP-binding protein [unclassified Bradyrhizobium]WGS17023.1 AMP-binding protein [Bradyrhizobium sp. ISRA463]WGS30741.1 AMP-binding protein [Bradyrhizobium sp. ISRA464]